MAWLPQSLAFLSIVRLLTWQLRAPSASKRSSQQGGCCITLYDLTSEITVSTFAVSCWLRVSQQAHPDSRKVELVSTFIEAGAKFHKSMWDGRYCCSTWQLGWSVRPAFPRPTSKDVTNSGNLVEERRGEFICLQGYFLPLCGLCPEQQRGWVGLQRSSTCHTCTWLWGCVFRKKRHISNTHKTPYGEEVSLNGW